MKPVRIATRKSELALVQARLVAESIEEALRVPTELVPMRTTGDRLHSASLARLGGKGLFVKEIEEALLDQRADVAVHSAKDLPALATPGLDFSCFARRGTFIIRPTRLAARMAPSSSSTSRSIFWRFHSSL